MSDVVVGFSRECGCVDVRDIGVERWRVVERDRGSREERVVMECIGYAEAITLAHLYGREQPGECAVHVPKAFLRFEDYERHDCLGEGSDLALPPGYGE